MSRTLSATIAELVSKRVLAEIPNVEITPIISHTAPTLDTPSIVATYPLFGFYDPDVVDAQVPFLQRVTFPTETMAHLPSPVGGAVDSLLRRITLSIVNASYRGITFFEHLTASAQLDRAEILLRTAVVPAGELGAPSAPFIGADSAGESVQWFEGIVDRVTAVSDQIELRAKTELPVTPWKLVPDTGTDPRDRGLRLPMVLGISAIVRCVNLDVGAVTVTNGQFAIDQLTVVVLDASDFPASGTVLIGAEIVSYTSKTANTLKGLTRGVLGTPQADHVVGSSVIEKASVVLGVSSIPIPSIKGLFTIGPTGTTIGISNLLYSVTHDDEVTAPGSSGDGITSITIDGDNLAVILNSVLADATVTQQAAYSAAVTQGSQTGEEIAPVASNTLVSLSTGAGGTWSTVTTAPNWVFARTGGTQQGLRSVFPSGVGSDSDLILRFVQFKFTVDIISAADSLTIGLAVSGVEGVLIGLSDGTIVATLDLDGLSGITEVIGSSYVAVPGSILGDLDPLKIDLVFGDQPSANPSIEFDVDEVAIDFGFQYDEEIQQSSIFDVNAGAQISGETQDWSGGWTSSNTWRPEQTAAASPTDQRFTNAWRVSDFGDISSLPTGVNTTIVKAVLVMRSGIVAPDNDVQANLTFSGTGADDWSNILVDQPDIVHEHIATTAISEIETSTTLRLRGGVTLDDFMARDVAQFNTGTQVTGETMKHAISTTAVELQLFASDPDAELEQIVDAHIQALAGGVGLEFFAICDGPEADDGTWNAAEDEVLSHPGDLMRYWLEDIHGLTNVDSATFSGSAYDTATPGYQFGFDARNLGSTFGEVLLRMGYEGSANVAQPSGGDWTITFPNASFQFPAPTDTVDSVADLIAIGKDTDEITTRLTVNSHFDPRTDSFDNRSFRQVQTTDPLAAAVITREAEFGRIDGDPVFLKAHNLTLGVTNWRLYQEQELGRQARIFSCRVDHWQGYALELGDTINFVHPLVDAGVAVKSRVIEVERSESRGIQIRAVEVL